MKFPANRGGRPAGSRTKLTKRLLDDLLADWEEHGQAAIKMMRKQDPSGYCKMVVSTLPRELTVETVHSDMDDEQIDQLIESMKQRLLDKRAAEAKQIETTKQIEIASNGRGVVREN
jgi:hypothetical protein